MYTKVMILVCMLGFAANVQAQTLRVAAAADLQFAMKELGSHFEQKTGIKVEISYGSSGNFRTQIENGAPFDLFFSADALYPQQLTASGAAQGDSLIVYAQGHLVLWAPAGAGLHLAERGFEVLKDERVQKIAIANPAHAPYGRAAVAALQKVGLYEQVKAKLVYGENISQAAQFAESGSAQIGILALSLTYAESMKGGERWEVPAEDYPALQQAAVIIQASKNKNAARAFLQLVQSEQGQRILLRYGFAAPGAETKP